MEKYIETIQRLVETAAYTFNQHESLQMMANVSSEKCKLYYI